MTRSRFPLPSVIVAVLIAYVGVVMLQKALGDDGPGAAAAARTPTVEQERAARDLVLEIDQLQVCHLDAHGRYTDQVADLTRLARDRSDDPGKWSGVLSRASEGRFEVELSMTDDGKAYTQRVRNEVIDTYLERREARVHGLRGLRRGEGQAHLRGLKPASVAPANDHTGRRSARR